MKDQMHQLEAMLCNAMRVAVSKDILMDFLPRKKRITAGMLDYGINLLLDNRKLPKCLSETFEEQTAEEILDEFCKNRNLEYKKNETDNTIIFKLTHFTLDKSCKE